MRGGQNFVLKHRPKRKRSERQRVGGREAGERRIRRGGEGWRRRRGGLVVSGWGLRNLVYVWFGSEGPGAGLSGG